MPTVWESRNKTSKIILHFTENNYNYETNYFNFHRIRNALFV